MAELKRIITGEIYCIAHIMRVNDEDCENRFCIGGSNATGDIAYPLAYLVERKENCTNCGEGKWDAEHQKILCDPVQCANGHVVFRNHEIEVCEYWKPKTEQKAEHNCQSCKYKNCGFKDFNTKNECDRWEAEQKAEKHFRPFKDTDELIKVWDKKFYLDFKPSHDPLTMPLIWVRDPKRPKVNYLLNGLMGNEVHWGSYIFNMQELFDNFEFLDGSPCGVEE